MEELDFKNSCIGFDWKYIPYYDREYLKTLYWDTTMSRNIIKEGEYTGISFKRMYPNASNFVVVRGHHAKRKYLQRNRLSDYVSSHLLNGRKYFLCWRYF